jgi:hypothetical protein
MFASAYEAQFQYGNREVATDMKKREVIQSLARERHNCARISAVFSGLLFAGGVVVLACAVLIQ